MTALLHRLRLWPVRPQLWTRLQTSPSHVFNPIPSNLTAVLNLPLDSWIAVDDKKLQSRRVQTVKCQERERRGGRVGWGGGEDEERIDGENRGRERGESLCVCVRVADIWAGTRLVFGAQSLPFRLSVSSFTALRDERKRGRGSWKKESKRLEQIRGEHFCGTRETDRKFGSFQ